MELCTPAAKVAEVVKAMDKKNADAKKDAGVGPGVDLSGMAGKKTYYYRELLNIAIKSQKYFL